jgi:hypothetical protein
MNNTTKKQSKVDKLERQHSMDLAMITMAMEEMKNKFEYTLDFLMDKHDIKQLKEIDIADKDMPNYVNLFGSYFMDKSTLAPVKIESIFKGWKLNKEQSDLTTGTLVYDHLEKGSVTIQIEKQEEAQEKLKKAILDLKPVQKIITDIYG